MFRSRVGTTIDMARLASAVSRPGIDPRIWVSYGILTSDPYIETASGEQDIFVDVMLLPSQLPETARVGAVYAGNGFGFYFPLKKDDEVLVCAPSGDPDEGLVITQRMWSPADVPPTEVTAHPDDVTLVVESGKSVRIGVAGGGKVYLGDVEASRGVARLNDRVLLGTQTVLSTVLVVDPPSGITVTTLADAVGTVYSTSNAPWTVTPPTPVNVPVVTNYYGKIDEASQIVSAA